ncbi:hypothetical protein [Shewanella sp.]|uniref:hypothetical protein n=1 Tax=Shewanella sp. TaxID=50422 RepID=UPI004054505D
MITLLANTFPIAQSLLSLSLPEITAVVLVMALILATAVLAQTWAPTHLAHSLKHILVATVNRTSAPKQQVTGISRIGFAPQQKITLGGSVNSDGKMMIIEKFSLIHLVGSKRVRPQNNKIINLH